jgi:N utilization substance protein A
VEKILDIVESIALEKNISKESATEAFKEALINTAKRLTSPSTNFEVVLDEDAKTFSIHRVITVVNDDDPRLEEEPDGYIGLSEAKEFDESLETGDQLKEEFDLSNFGRTASANLFKELEYHIQRRIEQDLFEKYRQKVGSVIIGTVSRVDYEENTHVEIGELKGILTRRNRIKGESFKTGDTVKALLRYVNIDPHHGLFLELSRTSPKFLEALMEKEVPEIADGTVEIVAAARIPGERAKVALKTDQPNVDPIGAAVGVKGVRINAVSDELNGENIDCIEYSPIPEIFITRALSPAITQNIKVDHEAKKAVVDITSDQKAKAIGKSGINIRLASMLTGYAIELNEVEGMVERRGESQAQEQQKTTDTSALESLFKI